MGEESITEPPPWKNACMTAPSFARDWGSAPVSKVRDVPMPITGSSSPELGIGRSISGALAADFASTPRV
jgi:hypothetical protein